MVCEFLNKSIVKLKSAVSDKSINNESLNWSECYRGLNEYSSDDDLANVHLFYKYPEPLLKFAAVCCIIFTIIGIPGNLITIIALSKYRKVRNATAVFIINLSFSDFLFSCINFPITAELFCKKSWTIGKTMCWLFPFFNYILSGAGLFSIVAITVNRYIMVSHPTYYPILYRSRNITIMIIAIWVGAIAMMMPVLFELWGRFSLDPRTGFCTIIHDKHGNSPKPLLVTMAFAFPCIFIVVCYCSIMYIVRKSTSKASQKPANTSNAVSDSTSRNPENSIKDLSSSDQQENDENDDVESNTRNIMTRLKNNFETTFKRKRRTPAARPTRRDKRLWALITAIMISFFACHLPILIVKTINLSYDPYGNTMGYMLLYVTSCSNPIIYVVLSKEYRQAYMHIFSFFRRR